MIVYDKNKKRDVFINLKNVEWATTYNKKEHHSNEDVCVIHMISGETIIVEIGLFEKICNKL